MCLVALRAGVLNFVTLQLVMPLLGAFGPKKCVACWYFDFWGTCILVLRFYTNTVTGHPGYGVA